jgi:EAL domain-containing protein (putative c-di-GMP-specific phosphodiesterase class I)
MSCTRCEVVPPDREIESLILSTPHASTRDKVLTNTRCTGVTTVAMELGVKIDLGGHKWESMLATAATGMTEPELTDTYVAVIPRGASAWDQQKAMFQAKPIRDRMAQCADSWLYNVLRQDRLTIHFQPLVRRSPQGTSVFGYECLMRGIDDNGGLIPPFKMLTAARRLDLVFLLDQRCRIAAVRAAAAQLASGTIPADTMFFINFLPTAIYNPEHCLQTTMAAVTAGSIRPEQICFEVVESEDVGDRDHLVNILSFYRNRGFKVALDDVGAGFSTLSAMSDLMPNFIKLDRDLVAKGVTSPMEGKIVRDLADTCRRHNIETLAEGIETAAEFAFVNDCGIELTQGYYHARPAAATLNDPQRSAVVTRAAATSERRAA